MSKTRGRTCPIVKRYNVDVIDEYVFPEEDEIEIILDENEEDEIEIILF